MLERFVCGRDLRAMLKPSECGLDKHPDRVGDEVRIADSVEAAREEKE